MSKIRYFPYAVLTAGLFFAGSAFAQTTWYDAREANQQERIQDGRRDGSLTRSEYNRLEQGERRIERYENRAERDGKISPAERARLDGMLDRQSREINQQRHDGQTADRNGWNHNGSGRDGWSHDRNGWGRDGDRNAWNNRGGDHDRNGNFDRRDDRRDNMADRRTTTPHDGTTGRGDMNRPDRGTHTGQAPTTGTTNRWNGTGHANTHTPAVTTRTQAATSATPATPRTRTSTRTAATGGTTQSWGGGHR